MHGANRLASNSLLEAVVVAELSTEAAIEARESIVTFEPPMGLCEEKPRASNSVGRSGRTYLSHALTELQRTMWDFVGVVRSDERLRLAGKRIAMLLEEIEDFHEKFPPSFDALELRNLVTAASLMHKSATIRKESRGLHFNVDYPERDDKHWCRDTVLKRDS